MTKRRLTLPKGMFPFFLLIALVAVGNGFSDSIYANYFNDAYQVTEIQRGFLEFPRELPGVLCAVVLTALSFMGDLRLSLLAQILACAGLMVLGLTTPSFSMMCVFLFINSLGMHLFFPLQDAIGMRLAEEGRTGVRMGQYAAIRSIVGFLCAICVFFGFRAGAFSFVTQIKPVFLLGAAGFALSVPAAVLLIRVMGSKNASVAAKPTAKMLFRHEYRYFYALSVLYGVQKQITYVYGSWVIIRVLGQGADAMSLLFLASNLLGMVFVPLLGRWLDRFGVRRLMTVNAFGFIAVYLVYAACVYALHSGLIAVGPVSLGVVCALFIIDRMSMQFALVKSVYLQQIAASGNDVAPALSAGTSLDHIVAIIAAPLCGLIWTQFGPHWVFLIAAVLSLGNVYVARRVK